MFQWTVDNEMFLIIYQLLFLTELSRFFVQVHSYNIFEDRYVCRDRLNSGETW